MNCHKRSDTVTFIEIVAVIYPEYGFINRYGKEILVKFLEYMLDNTPRLSERPGVYGAFHIISLFLILSLFVLMILFRHRLPRGEKNIRRSLIIFGVGLLLLEVGKQIVYSYDPVTGWEYNWSRFPFQFCSTPIYAALIAMCLPRGRVRRALLCFLGTYSPVAGCAVLFWPSPDVFSEILFLDIHTMLWHGAMLLFGLYIWLSEAISASWRTAYSAFAVFLPLNFIALLLNEAEHRFGFAGSFEFNMFYISRYYSCNIPFLDFVQGNAPYPVFFASFILLLGFGGFAVTAGMIALRFLAERKSGIRKEKES